MHLALYVALALFLNDPPHDAARLWWGDWNGDGRLDAVRARPGESARLLENRGDGLFADVSESSGWIPLERLRKVVFVDLDGNGGVDLLAVAGGRLVLFGGEGGVLVERTAFAGLDAFAAIEDARALDVDGDGRLDLWLQEAAGDRLLRQVAGGRFAELDLGSFVAGPREVASVRAPEEAGEDEQASEADRAVVNASEERPPERARGGSKLAAGHSSARPVLRRTTATDPESALGLAFCNTAVLDKSTGNCVYVNTVPTLGEVLPLSNDFNVDVAGNVGMGTTAPTHKLTIQGATNDALRLAGTGPFESGARLDFGDLGSVYLSEVTDDKLEVGAAAGTNFALGHVGIGQTDPSWPLDVRKHQAVGRFTTTGSTSGSVIELRNEVPAASSVGAVNFVNHLGQYRGQVAYTGADTLDFRAGGFQGMSLAPAGLDIDVPVDVQRALSGLAVLSVHNTATSAPFGSSTAVFGASTDPAGIGVWGSGLSNGDVNIGVYGTTQSANGFGMFCVGDFLVTGAKSFGQPHPTNAAKEIRFVCLEGNESGTYFRGRARTVGGEAVIDVPEDFRLVTEEEGLTVLTTPIGLPAVLWVAAQDLDRVVVRSNVDVEFSYFANGVRRGRAAFETIRENTAFVPRERGVPYGAQYPDDFRRLLVENGTLNPDFTPSETTAARLGWQLEEPHRGRQ